jgi:hypothetical protein
MRQQDVPHVDVVVAHHADQLVDLITRIDDHRLARPLARDDEAVLVKRRDGANLQDHQSSL